MGFIRDQIQGQIDDLKKESKLFSFIVDSLTSKSDRDKDVKDLKSPFWTYRFDSYEDALYYLNQLKIKYRESKDREMDDLISQAFRDAKGYWHK
jgi:hypothetical protein